jgi:hypothetical protein
MNNQNTTTPAAVTTPSTPVKDHAVEPVQAPTIEAVPAKADEIPTKV